MKINNLYVRFELFGGFLLILILLSIAVPGFAWKKPSSVLIDELPGVTDLLYFATDAPDNFIVYSPGKHANRLILPASERMADMVISPDGKTAWTATKSGFVDRYEIPVEGQFTATAGTMHKRIAPVLSSIAVSASGRFVAVGYGNTEDYNSRAVKILPAATLSVADQLAEFTVSGDIQDIVANPARDLFYIINSHSDRVRIYNAGTFRLETDILELGNSPGNFMVRPDGLRGYGAMNARQAVAVVDLEENVTTEYISLGFAPYAMCFSADGKLLYVASRDTSDVAVIDTEQNKVVNSFQLTARISGLLESNFAEMIGVSSNGKYLFVMPKRPELVVYDISKVMESANKNIKPEMVQSEILASTPFFIEVVRGYE